MDCRNSKIRKLKYILSTFLAVMLCVGIWLLVSGYALLKMKITLAFIPFGVVFMVIDIWLFMKLHEYFFNKYDNENLI